MPKVSVIVPNYNHARFLEQRVQSILNQTYQDFEIIYLDDASIDNSNEVFAQFTHDPRIRSILNQTNSGSPFKQWNKGIKAATGDYIWIAESDDFSDSTFLETLVSILDQHPNVGIVYSQSYEIDEHSQVLATRHWWTDDLDQDHWRSDFITRGVDECRNYLIIKNTIPNASAVVFRRHLYEAIGYAEEGMRLCGDWFTWIKLVLRSDLAYVAKPLNYYRTHISTVRSRSRLSGAATYEQMQIFIAVKEQIEVPKSLENKLKDQLVYEWVALAIARKPEISLKRTFEFYKLCKSCDSFVELRFLSKSIFHVSTKVQSKLKSFLPMKAT